MQSLSLSVERFVRCYHAPLSPPPPLRHKINKKYNKQQMAPLFIWFIVLFSKPNMLRFLMQSPIKNFLLRLFKTLKKLFQINYCVTLCHSHYFICNTPGRIIFHANVYRMRCVLIKIIAGSATGVLLTYWILERRGKWS